jgi:hypothetical protein
MLLLRRTPYQSSEDLTLDFASAPRKKYFRSSDRLTVNDLGVISGWAVIRALDVHGIAFSQPQIVLGDRGFLSNIVEICAPAPSASKKTHFTVGFCCRKTHGG